MTHRYIPGLVSVAIPAYNAADYLRQAIESVVNQTYRPIEIVVVDDGSSDHTRHVCESFGSEVRYYYQKNDGTYGAGARARAISKAKGEWIALLDQDDRWHHTKIEMQVEAIASDERTGVVFTAVKVIDSRGTMIVNHPEEFFFSEAPSGEVFHELLRGNRYCASSGFFRRDALSRTDLIELTKSNPADYDLWLRVTKNCNCILLRKKLTERRFHDKNYSNDNLFVIQSGVISILKKMHSMLHDDCDLCNEVYRVALATNSRFGAMLGFDLCQRKAAEGQYAEFVSLLIKSFLICPRLLVRPGRCLALLKSCCSGLPFYARDHAHAIKHKLSVTAYQYKAPTADPSTDLDSR